MPITTDCQWYGLGEQETYADRCKGAKLGIYSNKVKDNVARYMVPQECGAKCGVRWARVTNRAGDGMLFEMTEETGPMVFSALPYTPHEIENAMHPYELPPVHYTVVRVAKAQMGVGGDDSWGAQTHPEYLLQTDKNHAVFLCMERRGEHRSIITGSLQYSDPDLKAGCRLLPRRQGCRFPVNIRCSLQDCRWRL